MQNKMRKRNYQQKKPLAQQIEENRAALTGMARLFGNVQPVFSEMSTDKKKVKNDTTKRNKINDSAVLIVNESPVFIDASANLTPEKIEELKVFLDSIDED